MHRLPVSHCMLLMLYCWSQCKRGQYLALRAASGLAAVDCSCSVSSEVALRRTEFANSTRSVISGLAAAPPLSTEVALDNALCTCNSMLTY